MKKLTPFDLKAIEKNNAAVLMSGLEIDTLARTIWGEARGEGVSHGSRCGDRYKQTARIENRGRILVGKHDHPDLPEAVPVLLLEQGRPELQAGHGCERSGCAICNGAPDRPPRDARRFARSCERCHSLSRGGTDAVLGKTRDAGRRCRTSHFLSFVTA